MRSIATTPGATCNQPERLANRVYAHRYGNGSEASGDGWKYRGRGLAASHVPRQLRALRRGAESGSRRAARSAARARACRARRRVVLAIVNGNRYSYDSLHDVELLTRYINGGINGLKSRVELFERALKVLRAPRDESPAGDFSPATTLKERAWRRKKRTQRVARPRLNGRRRRSEKRVTRDAPIGPRNERATGNNKLAAGGAVTPSAGGNKGIGTVELTLYVWPSALLIAARSSRTTGSASTPRRITSAGSPPSSSSGTKTRTGRSRGAAPQGCGRRPRAARRRKAPARRGRRKARDASAKWEEARREARRNARPLVVCPQPRPDRTLRH
jgi:hypothetical protein